MTLNNAEFDNVRKDDDADEPLDGRDSQPVSGSSDAPDEADSQDPLRGVGKVLSEADDDTLQLNPETLLPEPVGDGEQRGEAPEQGHRANQPGHREDPDRG